MKKLYKVATCACLAVVLSLSLVLAGCSSQEGSEKYVVSIEQTATDESGSSFLIEYSDGSTSTFTVASGKDGEDGQDLTAQDVYEQYKAETGEELTYAEFLQKYLDVTADNGTAVNESLRSAIKVYAEFIETQSSSSGGWWSPVRPSAQTAVYTGSGVIYDIADDGYTYFVTNYHVVYDSAAAEDNATGNSNGANIARKIVFYLYGSEGAPVQSGTGSDGYTAYDYGQYAIECEYVGGSIESDIAVLRAPTDEVKEVNEDICEVELADDYYVGETAIAVGNTEGEGISVTQGVVSVDSEYITLSDIDGTARSCRVLRIDTAIYGGNSGGGLFNKDGKLIGITNAGNTEDQNINYAIPLEIVRGTVENILYYYGDGDAETTGAYKITFGVTVTTQNSKYTYDSSVGYGKISEEVVVSEITAGSIAEQIGLAEGDIITALVVDGAEHELDRSFNISELALTLRPGNAVSFRVERNGSPQLLQSYTLQKSDLVSI